MWTLWVALVVLAGMLVFNIVTERWWLLALWMPVTAWYITRIIKQRRRSRDDQ